jgi:Sigma-70, region 4
VLEKLTPGERLAFVLHDMFGFPFEEIAPALERSVPARTMLERGAPFAHLAQPAVVDGNAGLVVAAPGRVLSVVKCTFDGDRLLTIDVDVQM